jgi:hypothetical protein
VLLLCFAQDHIRVMLFLYGEGMSERYFWSFISARSAMAWMLDGYFFKWNPPPSKKYALKSSEPAAEHYTKLNKAKYSWTTVGRQKLKFLLLKKSLITKSNQKTKRKQV